MTKEGYKRKLTAILSADVVGYSSLMDDNEAETIRTLKNNCSVITTLVGHNRGRVVDIAGDNLLAEFHSLVDAVNCGTEIQLELSQRNKELPDNRKMEFRIGINVGDVVEENGRIYGDGVNIAARIQELADAGGICISGGVYDQIENKLDLAYSFLGEHKVKNITRPIRVYVVKLAPEAAKTGMGKKYESPAKPSIAVLPFLNMSGDLEQEYFSDGITEDIITALSKFRWFFVIARNSTFSFKGKEINVTQVAEDLGVRYVLEGSVRKAGMKVRITAQLIDASTGYHVWAERYDRDLEDIFSVQDEITHQIVRSVGPEFLSAEMKRAQRKDALTLDVWDYIMKASSHHGRYTKTDTKEAQRLLHKAINLDPKFPGGHRLVAASCGQLGLTQEAAGELKEVLKLMPGMTAEDVKKQVPFKRPRDMERYIEGLRKAGLKE
jgi:adenylate cyclase